MTKVTDPIATSRAGLRWGQIFLAAFLLELTLFVVLVPIGLAFGMPGAGNASNYTVFFITVPVGCLIFGFLFGRWIGKRVESHHLLHGALVGIVAFAIYLAVCSIPPNTIAMVIAGYGAPLFWLVNVLRLVGCVAGAAAVRRR